MKKKSIKSAFHYSQSYKPTEAAARIMKPRDDADLVHDHPEASCSTTGIRYNTNCTHRNSFQHKILGNYSNFAQQ